MPELMNQSGRPDDAATPNDHLARLISSTGAGNAQLLGESLLGAGRVTEAQKLFQQLVFLQPEHAASRAGLGLAMMAAGSTEAALATLARALELDPGDKTIKGKLRRPRRCSAMQSSDGLISPICGSRAARRFGVSAGSARRSRSCSSRRGFRRDPPMSGAC